MSNSLKVLLTLVALPIVAFGGMFVYYFIVAPTEDGASNDTSVATTTVSEITQKDESPSEVSLPASENKPVAKHKDSQSGTNKTLPPVEGDAKTKSTIALTYYPEATETDIANIKKALTTDAMLFKNGDRADVLRKVFSGQATDEEIDEAVNGMSQEEFEFMTGTLLPNIEGQLSFLQSPNEFSVRILSRDETEIQVAYVLKENDKNASFFKSQTFLSLGGELKVLYGNY